MFPSALLYYMEGNMALTGDIILDYLDRYPDTATLTLAKKIYRENKEAFSGVEAVRSRIRYYRGQNGKLSRDSIATKQHFKEEGSKSPFEALPEGLRHWDDWDPVYIETKKNLIISDTHIPYHEKAPFIMALEFGLKHGCDGVIFLGDLMDFFSVSFWEKDPRKRNFQQELEIGRGVLATIRDAFPDANIYYKLGNHEERYYRYLSVKAPELLGVDKFEFREIMQLDHYGVQLITDKRILRIGKLSLIHGHEFGRSITSPVNPARGLYLKGKETAVAAHYHQSSEHIEKSMGDVVISCWSMGCLCDLHPDWLPINKWNWGFGVVRLLDDEGEFEVWNKKIIEGSIY